MEPKRCDLIDILNKLLWLRYGKREREWQQNDQADAHRSDSGGSTSQGHGGDWRRERMGHRFLGQGSVRLEEQELETEGEILYKWTAQRIPWGDEVTS